MASDRLARLTHDAVQVLERRWLHLDQLPQVQREPVRGFRALHVKPRHCPGGRPVLTLYEVVELLGAPHAFPLDLPMLGSLVQSAFDFVGTQARPPPWFGRRCGGPDLPFDRRGPKRDGNASWHRQRLRATSPAVCFLFNWQRWHDFRDMTSRAWQKNSEFFCLDVDESRGFNQQNYM